MVGKSTGSVTMKYTGYTSTQFKNRQPHDAGGIDTSNIRNTNDPGNVSQQRRKTKSGRYHVWERQVEKSTCKNKQ